jgi:hypothetical protein
MSKMNEWHNRQQNIPNQRQAQQRALLEFLSAEAQEVLTNEHLKESILISTTTGGTRQKFSWLIMLLWPTFLSFHYS